MFETNSKSSSSAAHDVVGKSNEKLDRLSDGGVLGEETLKTSSSEHSISRRSFLRHALLGGAGLMIGTTAEEAWATELRRFSNPEPASQRPHGASSAGSGSKGPSPGPFNSQSDHDFWNQPRVLNIKRYQNNESLQVAYWRNGQLDVEGYNKVCWLMRDLRAGKHARIDPRLLDLVCAMQAWVSYYGYKKPFFVSSGYRTLETNRQLEGAARNSMHLKGRAVDLIIPDLPVSYLGKLAQHYSAGGVGFYPSSGFVHVDTGNIRSWHQRRRK